MDHVELELRIKDLEEKRRRCVDIRNAHWELDLHSDRIWRFERDSEQMIELKLNQLTDKELEVVQWKRREIEHERRVRDVNRTFLPLLAVIFVFGIFFPPLYIALLAVLVVYLFKAMNP